MSEKMPWTARANRIALAAGLSLALATVSTVAFTSPAYADPLAVTLDCNSPSYAFYMCDVTITGGVSPYTKTWVGTNAWPIDNSNFGHCAPGEVFTLKLKVVDATGAKKNDTSFAFCQDQNT
jgi:hypothetical protein